MNDNNHWIWNTSSDGTATRACTKSFDTLCIRINETDPDFIIEYNQKHLHFLNDDDWNQTNIIYPMKTIITPSRRQLMNYYDWQYYNDYLDDYYNFEQQDGHPHSYFGDSSDSDEYYYHSPHHGEQHSGFMNVNGMYGMGMMPYVYFIYTAF